ncbi:hypothetical protein [Edwardsiella ictaluri]
MGKPDAADADAKRCGRAGIILSERYQVRLQAMIVEITGQQFTG